MQLHLQGRRGSLHQSRYFEVLGELQRRYPLVLGDDLLVAGHLLRERLGRVEANRGELSHQRQLALKAASPLSGSSRPRTRSGR